MKALFFSLSRSRPSSPGCSNLSHSLEAGGRGIPIDFNEASGRAPRNSFSGGRVLSPALPQSTSTACIFSLRRSGSRQAINRLAIPFFLSLFSLLATAQHKNEPSNPEQPTITFDLYWADATPQNYTITVESSGKTKYVSRNPTRKEEDADPIYEVEFTLSSAKRDRLFTLGKATNYFQGDFDFKHKVANTGKKTLTYADPTRHFQTTYNYSENKDVQEITKLFQGISNTIEHGRKLQFLRRFDKLGLERELAGMEQMAQNGYLAEIQIIAPTLQNIINDSTVLNMARDRARRLLESKL